MAGMNHRKRGHKPIAGVFNLNRVKALGNTPQKEKFIVLNTLLARKIAKLNHSENCHNLHILFKNTQIPKYGIRDVSQDAANMVVSKLTELRIWLGEQLDKLEDAMDKFRVDDLPDYVSRDASGEPLPFEEDARNMKYTYSLPYAKDYMELVAMCDEIFMRHESIYMEGYYTDEIYRSKTREVRQRMNKFGRVLRYFGSKSRGFIKLVDNGLKGPAFEEKRDQFLASMRSELTNPDKIKPIDMHNMINKQLNRDAKERRHPDEGEKTATANPVEKPKHYRRKQNKNKPAKSQAVVEKPAQQAKATAKPGKNAKKKPPTQAQQKPKQKKPTATPEKTGATA